mmetsp:Transcript_2640/g.7939  ORF Transcript_2640/g.7939 Transcript_2640/m.7939 type:complete len:573 (-) Transcript_2640:216-1934(-)
MDPALRLVYCQSSLLDAVQRLEVFGDSKTFVDLPLLVEPGRALAAFEALSDEEKTSRERVAALVRACFAASPDDELEPWTPDDWVAEPAALASVVGEQWRPWALDLNARWKQLGRRARQSPDFKASSLLAPPHPFVAPGGRFREVYYWDSFWIVKGLLACGMRGTAVNVADNLLCYVQTFGFVPNGGRLYYLNRSQPPLLSEIVVAILEDDFDFDFAAAASHDDDDRRRQQQRNSRGEAAASLARRAVPLLEVEYDWWMRRGEHAVELSGGHVLNRYWTASVDPRPESYREDLATAAEGGVHASLAAAAESGWDFSSRWMTDDDLSSTATDRIVPVDLNAIMLRFEANLALLHDFLDSLLGHDGAAGTCWRRAQQQQNTEDRREEPSFSSEARESSSSSSSSRRFRRAGAARRKAIEALLWRDGCWTDLGGRPGRTYASDFVMLWAGGGDDLDDAAQAQVLAKLLPLVQRGGVLTSLVDSGQQWDQPNAWPPLQYFIIRGLQRLRAPAAHDLARTLRSRWLDSNYRAWAATGAMFEKLDAFRPGVGGGGGEYEPQLGFGWTNGVVLDLLTHD